MPDRKDPLANYNFVVEIDGQVLAGFKEVSGLESRIEVIEYREGGEKFFPVRKLPGRELDPQESRSSLRHNQPE